MKVQPPTRPAVYAPVRLYLKRTSVHIWWAACGATRALSDATRHTWDVGHNIPPSVCRCAANRTARNIDAEGLELWGILQQLQQILTLGTVDANSGDRIATEAQSPEIRRQSGG